MTVQQASHSSSRYLLWWLMIAIFFEYARPGSFVSGLDVLKLNSLIPLSLVVACLFSSGLRPMKQVMRDPAAKWLLAYFCIIALSLLHANVNLALEVVRSTLGYLLLAFAVARICTTAEHVRGVFAALVVAHLFLIIMNPATLTNPEQRNYIIGGTFLGDGNDFALSICILLPMTIELALASKSRFLRWFWWLSILLLAMAVIATQSRGGTLAMMAVGGAL